MEIDWNADRVGDLRRLWAEGYSGSQIAGVIGCSRCAVLGKAHRLGLPPRRTQSRAVGRVQSVIKPRQRRAYLKPKFPRAPKIVRVHVDLPEPSGAMRCDFMSLQFNSCRFPYDNPEGGFLFCGEVTKKDASYCEYHWQICHEGTVKSKAPYWQRKRIALIGGVQVHRLHSEAA